MRSATIKNIMHTKLSTNTLIFILAAFIANFVRAQEPQPENKITFDDHVKPILVQRCSSCHGNGKKEADLDVTNYTALMMGGGSGEVISAGTASDSYLYKLITHDESPEMPPNGTKIPDAEIQMIADWINVGALENAGSKPQKSKPKLDLALSADASVRPEDVAIPLRMPLQPAIQTKRPSLTAIATSPWAPIAAIAAPKQVLLYQTKNLELVGVLPMEEGIAHCLRFSRNGSLLLGAGGKDGQLGTVVIWDVKTGQRVTTIGAELDVILAADISSNHELVAFGGPNKLVKVCLISDGSLRFELNKHTDWVTAIEFSPDGKYLATGDRNGGLHIWETATGSELYALTGHTLSITGLSWRADSLILASASEDSTVRTWEMKNGKQVKNWPAHAAGATSIEFLRDGRLVTSGRDKTAKLWDQSGKELRVFPGLPDVAVAVSYCDESSQVICGDWTGEVRVFNAADAAVSGNLVANPPTLEKRIADSQSELAAASERLSPILEAITQSQTKLSELTTALVSTKQSRQQMATKVTDSESQLVNIRQQFDSTATQQEHWRIELDEKTMASPLIVEAYAKAIAAAKSLPADEELKQTVSLLESKKAAIEARTTELKSLVEKSNQEKVSVKSKLDELAETLQTDQQQLQQLTAEVTQLESAMGPLTQQVVAETQAATAVKSEVQEAEQQIAKWNDNLEFIKQLDALHAQLEQVEQTAASRQAEIDQANQKLVEAKKMVDQAEQEKRATESQADEIREKITDLQNSPSPDL